MTIYVETLNNLSAGIVSGYCQKRTSSNADKANVIYIDSSIKSLPKLESQLGCNLRRLEFTFDDIRDDQGTTVGWLIRYGELQKFLHATLKHSSYTYLFQFKAFQSEYFPFFFNKNIANLLVTSEWPSLWSTLLKINVVSWYHSLKKDGIDQCIFVLEDRLWKEVLSIYAQTLNVKLKWQPTKYKFKEYLKIKQYHFPKTFDYVKKCLGLINRVNFEIKVKNFPKISIESIGNFNLHEPELSSDIAYWHQSELSSNNLLLYSTHPVTNKQWNECKKEGIDLISLSKNQIKEIPVFSTKMRKKPRLPLISRRGNNSKECQFVQDQIRQYNYKKNYWLSLFEITNTKIHITHFKYDNSHIPKADAINELGGISILWQMSYEELPSTYLAIISDIMFGFSPFHASTEQKHGSKTRYHIATGYPGDYRFKLLKPKAEIVRKKLLGKGAKKIIAYFDENSVEDERWSIGNSTACRDYGFLLEKVLAVPWLGVIFKPKKPHTLRKRLKAIDALFENAIATGRCHVFMAEASGIPPAIAALSSDVAIHGSVWAATAAIEASLTGTQTLLIDHDNWHMSQLYQLGKEKVIFQSWQDLWDTLLDHWKIPQGIQGLGDWSLLLDELDPFRDGKAAERMGNYLHWLIQGFEEGLDKEVIMADAAERYGRQWGTDMVTTNIGL